MELGNKLKQIRKSFGYSQEKLANMVGVSLISVSRIERNEQPPSLAFIAEFAKICNVSVDSLLELTQESNLPKASQTISEIIPESLLEKSVEAKPLTSHGEFISLVYNLAEAKKDTDKYQLSKACIASYMQLLDEKNKIQDSFEKLQRLASKIKKR